MQEVNDAASHNWSMSRVMVCTAPAAASAFACALAKLLAAGATAATAVASSAAGSAAAFLSRASFSSAGSVHVVTLVLVL
jgi:hypothetical protein